MQIADFGMARDLEESDYYISQGGKVPVKWTAPEVGLEYTMPFPLYISCFITSLSFCDGQIIFRHPTLRSIPLPAMCGALVYCCLRSGAWDTNHLKNILTLRYINRIVNIMLVL